MDQEVYLFSYEIVDGPTRERHYWIMPAAVDVADLMEWVGSVFTIDRGSIRLEHAGVWDGYSIEWRDCSDGNL